MLGNYELYLWKRPTFLTHSIEEVDEYAILQTMFYDWV